PQRSRPFASRRPGAADVPELPAALAVSRPASAGARRWPKFQAPVCRRAWWGGFPGCRSPVTVGGLPGGAVRHGDAVENRALAAGPGAWIHRLARAVAG